MASTKELKDKIKSLANMQKVMRAMKMIASVKFARAFPGLEGLQVFEKSLDQIREDISSSLADSQHPLVRTTHPGRTHVVVITADRGLCGSHNNSVIKVLDQFMKDRNTTPDSVEMTCIGTKSRDHALRQGYKIVMQKKVADFYSGGADYSELVSYLVESVSSNQIQEVFVIFNQFQSMLLQSTTQRQILPLSQSDQEDASDIHSLGLIEPEGVEFVLGAVNILVEFQLRAAVRNSELSEHAARMTAMENATNNAKDLVKRYELVRNRARQSSITNELIEIISGKEALKG